MVATDDVLLLRPAEPSYAFRLEGSRRGADAGGDGPGFVAVTVVDLDGAEPSQAVELFEQALPTSLVESGGSLLGCYVTEPSPNTFPALTVREGENVLAWFAGHDELPTREVGSRQIPGKQPQQFLRLAPTSRSLLHGSAPGARRGEAHTSLRKGDR